MKHFIIPILLLAVCTVIFGQTPSASASLEGTSGFYHPGCLHSQKDFDRISQQIATGSNAAVVRSWQMFQESDKVKQTTFWLQTNPGVRHLERFNNGGNFANCHRDFGACYVKAIYWALKHNSSNATETALARKYASDAVAILNCYAKQIVGIRGDSNFALLTGFQGWQVANAAEILRNFDGWNPTDYQKFRQWMIDVWATSAYDFLYRQNETCDSHYQSNWNTSVITSLQAIAIFLDDPFFYNYAMMQIKQGYTNASLNPEVIGTGGVPTAENGYTDYHGFLPYIYDMEQYNAEHGTHYQSPLGVLCQNQENTRDQAHAQGALGTQEQTCEQAWNQGDDLWDYNNRVMAGGVEYCAGWLSATPTDSAFMKNYPWGKWESNCGNSHDQQQISYAARENKDPIFQISYNHFANRMGLNMPYAKKQHEALGGVEIGTGQLSYSDLAGYGDLMHNEDSATTHPTLLTGHITMVSGSNQNTPLSRVSGKMVRKTLEGYTYNFPEMSHITKGSVVKLEPVIIDGSTDTGNWQWEDDPSITTREREVTVEQSRILRAFYINAEGVQSRQLFVLHCAGEGAVPTIKSYYVKNGVHIYNDKIISVKKGAKVDLGIETNSQGIFKTIVWEKYVPSTDKWSTLTTGNWTANTGAVNKTMRVRATMTLVNGAEVQSEYTIIPSTMAITVENELATSDAGSAWVERGSDVMLTAAPTQATAKLSSATRNFHWTSNGTTLQEHTLTGKQVTDTLHISTIKEPIDIELDLMSIYNERQIPDSAFFSLKLYDRNVQQEGHYYIIDPATGNYLNNKTANFESYNSETDDVQAFLWNISKRNVYDGEHYLISSSSDRNMYLNANGKLQSLFNTDILLDVMQECEGNGRNALRSTKSSLFRTLYIDEYGSLALSTDSVITQFPFCFQQYEGMVTDLFTNEDTNMRYMLQSVKILADKIGGLEGSVAYQQMDSLLTATVVPSVEAEIAMRQLRLLCREQMSYSILQTATATKPFDLTCFIKNPNITQNTLDASGQPNNALVDGWTCVACADGHARTEALSGDTWLYCYSWSGKAAYNIASATDYSQVVGNGNDYMAVNLPDGTYRLEAATFAASGADCLQLYARNTESIVKQQNFNASENAWTQAQKKQGTTTKVNNITVIDGQLTIGIKGSAVIAGNGKSWRADNFRLYLTKVAEPTVILSPSANKEDENVMYNLYGIKVDGSYKGIVIKSGHKYFLK